MPLDFLIGDALLENPRVKTDFEEILGETLEHPKIPTEIFLRKLDKYHQHG